MERVGGLTFGVVSAMVKIRPGQRPPTTPGASLRAGRNEFEAFQVVVHAERETREISLVLSQPLTGPGGFAIPAANLVVYQVGYYEIVTPSFPGRDTRGRWPDPLIPAVDTYVGEQRRGLPLTVPAGEGRAIWVDLLVPKSAPPGDYSGKLELRRAGKPVGSIPIALRVGRFTLPSTPTLLTAFNLDFEQPCQAHTGQPTCAATEGWKEGPANTLRARYVRAALEHRVSISDVFWQPPQGDSAKAFAAAILPYVDGQATDLRLPGARSKTIALTPGDEPGKNLGHFVSYAKARGLLGRAFYLVGDEPAEEGWAAVKRLANTAHGIERGVQVAVATSELDAASKSGALDKLDVLIAPIELLDPADGEDAALGRYRDWQRRGSARLLWARLGCRAHGCGSCGGDGAGEAATGTWPTRVIDATAVQNRALPWLLFRQGIRGELSTAGASKLGQAWDKDGACQDSGAGEGTLFYPGTPARIGGKTHIPIESIRLKLLRESVEDHEYLALASARDAQRAKQIAAALFPNGASCDKSAAALEEARRQLFELLDKEATSP